MKTKNHLDKKLSQELSIFEVKMDLKLDSLKDGIDDNSRKYRDQILQGLDEVMGELQTLRQENTIGFHQIKERLDNHNRGIKHLEHFTKAI
ncbi:hypothetical protein HY404_03410 [Candidatus Microgenomates bacterium]|nr:hypothetical protein [Candidatus Microgenomates bacterium]